MSKPRNYLPTDPEILTISAYEGWLTFAARLDLIGGDDLALMRALVERSIGEGDAAMQAFTQATLDFIDATATGDMT